MEPIQPANTTLVQEQLPESNVLLSKLASQVPGILYQFLRRPDGTYCFPYTSRTIQGIFGSDGTGVCHDATPLFKAILPEDRSRVIQTIEASAQNLTPWECEYRVQLPGQPVRWLWGKSTPEKLADGSILWHGYTTEITPRKQTEEELQATEERYRLLVENTSDHIARYSHDGTVLFASNAVQMLQGFTPEELVGTSGLARVHPEERPQVEAVLKNLMQAVGASAKVEYRVLCKDGQYKWVEAVGKALANKHTCQLEYIVAIRDISERKRAEAIQQQSESLLRAVVDNIPFEFWARDTEGRCIMENAALRQHWGSLLGQRPEDAKVSPEELAIWLANNRRAMAGELVQGEVEYVVEGQNQIFNNIIVPFRVGQEMRGLLGFNINITKRKQAEAERENLQAQLMQAQKLEGIGQLAGGVAHDFNNIMASIMMNLGLLHDNPHLDPEALSMLKDLEKEARRAATLTRQLLAFSRRSIMQVKVLDLNELLGELMKMLRRLIGENITVQTGGAGGDLWIEADAGMIEQVIVNLTVNARDAMPKGGSLSLFTHRTDITETPTTVNSEARPGQFVCLTVTDTGCGMDGVTMKRIFEPFFTTKEVGKGTGLGLATVHGIVKQHNGWVEVESAVGQGTTFRVYLPAKNHRPETCELDLDPPPTARGHETILLVEDEASLRKATGRFLARNGYTILEASNGKDALRQWEQNQARIHLLYTDMIMPGGMTGLELAERLQAQKPGLPAIISSGYSTELVQPDNPIGKGIVYVPKPCAPSLMLKIVYECLAGKRPA
jgi:PAS domain S-box-containing protein